jgi:WD40 repeat protein
VATPVGVFISYAHRDSTPLAARLAHDLGVNSWIDVSKLRAGDIWEREIESALDSAEVVLALLSPGSYASEICRAEQMRALRKGKCVIPLLALPCDFPLHFESRQYLDLTNPAAYPSKVETLLDDIRLRRGNALRESYRKTYVTAPDLPFNFVPRPELLIALRNIILSAGDSRHIALTALQGMGGIGKTVLAQALCLDSVVQAAFPDGIAWITLGREGDPKFVEKMRELAKALGDDLSFYDTYQGCVNRYRTVIREKAALIVVDDVWNARDLEPFRVDSTLSRMLFTTRDSSIAAAIGANEFQAELLTADQSLKFLALWAGRAASNLPPQAEDLIRECGRLPLALAMIGAMLKGKPDAFWNVVLNLLSHADLARIRAQFPNYPHASLFAAIQLSVDNLDDRTRSRYLALAVLLEDLRISPLVLRSLWNVEDFDAAATAEQLISLSLAQRDDEAIRLHDLQVDYIRSLFQDPAALKLIHGAMHLSSYVFNSDATQFASQITGRLLPHTANAAVSNLLETISRGAPRPWMRPVFPAMIAPGTPLLSTLNVGGVNQISPSPDPRRIVLAAAIGVVILDIESFREVLVKDCGSVTSIAISRQAPLAVYAAAAGITFWNPIGGTDLHTFPGDSVKGMDFSRDGRRLLIHLDNWLVAWDFETHQEILREQADDSRFGPRTLEPLAITPDGSLAVFCLPNNRNAETRTIRVFDLSAQQTRFDLAHHRGRVNALCITSDSHFFVSVSDDCTICIWSLETGVLLRTLTGHRDWILCAAISPDDRWLITGSYDQSVRLWDFESGTELRILGSHSDPVSSVAFNSTGSLAVSHAREGTLKIWDLRIEEMPDVERHSGFVKGVALTSDNLCISASSDTTVKIWDTKAGNVIRTITANQDKISSLAISLRYRRAVTGSDDATVRVLDIDSGEQIWCLDALGHVRNVALSADGRWIASSSKDIRIWDIETGELVAVLSDEGFGRGVAFMPDRNRIVVGMNKGVEHFIAMWEILRETQSGQFLHRLNDQDHYIDSLAVNAAGTRVVSGSYAGTIKLWDASQQRELFSWKAHDSGANSLAFSPDGRRFVSASGDCKLKVWDVGTASLVSTFTFDRSGRCCTYGARNLIVGGDKSGSVYFLELMN